jgi:hypothetical protein
MSEKPSWWRPVWICLAGEQALPNAIPAIAFHPEKVMLLHTDMVGSRDSARRCKKLLESRGIAVDLYEVNPFDIPAISEMVASLIRATGAEKVVLNWTGGTKPMSIAALKAMPNAAPNIYFDVRKGILQDMSLPFQSLPEGKTVLTLDDHFRLNSDAFIKKSLFANMISNESTAAILQLARSNPKVIDILSHEYKRELRSCKDSKGVFLSPPPQGIEPPLLRISPEMADHLASSMDKDGLLHSITPFKPNKNGLKYLDGFWWEAFVYSRLSSALSEIGESGIVPRQNVVIGWTDSEAENEIDIAFHCRDRVYLVSCTTASEKDAETRRQAVENLAEHLGGHFARAMLATTSSDTTLSTLRGRSTPNTPLPSWREWLKPAKLINAWLGR